MAMKRARSPSRPAATFLTFHYTKPLSIFTDSTRKATLSIAVLILYTNTKLFLQQHKWTKSNSKSKYSHCLMAPHHSKVRITFM